jgi:Domain of unknown function (DUF4214)
MKTFAAMITAMLLACGLGAAPVKAQAYDEVGLVNGWYRQYLGRDADPSGAVTWTRALRCAGPEATQAGILASEEYYCRAGHTPEGFVASLYADVLGRQACAQEIRDWVDRLCRCKGREQLALDFLVAARTELAQRAAVPPPPPATVLVPSYTTGYRGVPRDVPGRGDVRFEVRYRTWR